MTSFPVKSDLPKGVLDEIERIEAITSSLRNTEDAAFLTSRAAYLTNEILQTNEAGEITKCAGETVPVYGLAGFAKGCLFLKKDVGAYIHAVYKNYGTNELCNFDLLGGVSSGDMDENLLRIAEVEISAADIVATGAGKLGHAQGYPLIAAPGAGKVIELISAVLIYDYATAAYGGGGNVTLNWAGGGAAITGLVSAANSLGASVDKVVQFLALAAAGNAMSPNTAINLVAASAFTQPGTAAGVVRVKLAYRVISAGL